MGSVMENLALAEQQYLRRFMANLRFFSDPAGQRTTFDHIHHPILHILYRIGGIRADKSGKFPICTRADGTSCTMLKDEHRVVI
ncbi:hypothetical protein D1872_321110 [compost metagenome]